MTLVIVSDDVAVTTVDDDGDDETDGCNTSRDSNSR